MNKKLIKDTLDWLLLTNKEEIQRKINSLKQNILDFENSQNKNYKMINFEIYYNSKIFLRYINIFKLIQNDKEIRKF